MTDPLDYIEDQNHNGTPQKNVIVNEDPALRKDREHRHPHLHHDATAKKGGKDETVYSQGTTFEDSTVPHQDPQDHDLHRRKHADTLTDPEKADLSHLSHVRSEEEDPQTHALSNVYSRYRMFFHLFIWLVFTGSAVSLSCHIRHPRTDMCLMEELATG